MKKKYSFTVDEKDLILLKKELEIYAMNFNKFIGQVLSNYLHDGIYCCQVRMKSETDFVMYEEKIYSARISVCEICKKEVFDRLIEVRKKGDFAYKAFLEIVKRKIEKR